MNNPALFYFWAHNRPLQLRTSRFKKVISQAEVIFCEKVSESLEELEAFEKAFHAYIQNKLISLKEFDTAYVHHARFLKNCARKGQRFIFERTLTAQGDFNKERQHRLVREDYKADCSFFDAPDTVLEKKYATLTALEEFQKPREENVVQQILAIHEPLLAIFGAAHLDIEARVKAYRPTEVHFPYQRYRSMYLAQLDLHFRANRSIDQNLFLRSIIERVALGAFKDQKQYTERDAVISSQAYADLFTKEQITGYRDFFNSRRKEETKYWDLFPKYLKEENLPSLEETVKKIRRKKAD